MTTHNESWAAAIDAWTRFLRSGGAPSTTIRTRTNHLRRFAAEAAPRGPWDVDDEYVADWTAEQSWALETRRSYRSSLRSFYGWGVATHRVDESPAAGLPSVPQRPPMPRPASEPAYAAALTHAEPRERLMLRLAAEAGLRRGEVSRVHSRDVEPDLLGWSLRVHGKGGKLRKVPLTDDLAAELRARPAGYTFPGADHGHLSPWWVGRLVAELLPAGFTMHTLRHRFATTAYTRSHDLLAVQQLLGHASPATTRAYVKIDDATARAVVELVAQPAAA